MNEWNNNNSEVKFRMSFLRSWNFNDAHELSLNIKGIVLGLNEHGHNRPCIYMRIHIILSFIVSFLPVFSCLLELTLSSERRSVRMERNDVIACYSISFRVLFLWLCFFVVFYVWFFSLLYIFRSISNLAMKPTNATIDI